MTSGPKQNALRQKVFIYGVGNDIGSQDPPKGGFGRCGGVRELRAELADVINAACTTANLVRTRAHGGRDLGIPGRLLPDHRALGRTDLHP